MDSKITSFDGKRLKIELSPSNEHEARVVTALKNYQQLDDSGEMTVAHWVETALARGGYHHYHLVGYDGFTGWVFAFTVQKARGI